MRPGFSASLVLAVLAFALIAAAAPPESENGYLKLGFDRLKGSQIRHALVRSWSPMRRIRRPRGRTRSPADVKWLGTKS